MHFILVSEILNCRQNRGRGGLTKATEGRLDNIIREVHQGLDVPFPAFPLTDIAEEVMHYFCPYPARHTLSAGLISSEIKEEFRGVNHTGAVVHDDHPTGTNNGPALLDILIGNADIEKLPGKTPA